MSRQFVGEIFKKFSPTVCAAVAIYFINRAESGNDRYYKGIGGLELLLHLA